MKLKFDVSLRESNMTLTSLLHAELDSTISNFPSHTQDAGLAILSVHLYDKGNRMYLKYILYMKVVNT